MLRPTSLFSLSISVASLLLAGCSSGADSGSDATPAPAPADTTPDPGAGTPPRDIPAGYEDALKETLSDVDSRTGLGPDLAVDVGKLQTNILDLLHTGGKDANEGFRLGMRAILAAYPVGHLQIYPSDPKKCSSIDYPMQGTSYVGACTQPYQDHAVVSFVSAGNDLGLVAGDEILAVDGKQGQAMLDAAFAKPMCGTASPSASNRRATSATSIFSNIAVGSTVTIKHASGATETRTVSKIGSALSCRDPFGRSSANVAEATIRPDGAGVLRLPSFFPKDYDQNDPEGSIQRFTAAIKAEFDKVKDAPFLVIDVRANGGGSTPVGMAIAGGMPGAKSVHIADCAARTPGTTSYGSHFAYDFAQSSDFAYAGKAAVLADGFSFSATDYFVRVLREGTSTLVVGRPAAAAYGGSTDPVTIAKGPGVLLYPDPWRCVDAAGAPLEGHMITPDIEQDLAPADLATGVDTDVEAALARLRGGP